MHAHQFTKDVVFEAFQNQHEDKFIERFVERNFLLSEDDAFWCSTNSNGNSFFFEAICTRNDSIINSMLGRLTRIQDKLKPKALYALNRNKQSLFWLAASLNLPHVLKQLIELSDEIDSTKTISWTLLADDRGITPLHVASDIKIHGSWFMETEHVADILLNSWKDRVSYDEFFTILHSGDCDGYTSMHHAIHKKNPKLLFQLIGYGANFHNTFKNISKQTIVECFTQSDFEFQKQFFCFSEVQKLKLSPSSQNTSVTELFISRTCVTDFENAILDALRDSWHSEDKSESLKKKYYLELSCIASLRNAAIAGYNLSQKRDQQCVNHTDHAFTDMIQIKNNDEKQWAKLIADINKEIERFKKEDARCVKDILFVMLAMESIGITSVAIEFAMLIASSHDRIKLKTIYSMFLTMCVIGLLIAMWAQQYFNLTFRVQNLLPRALNTTEFELFKLELNNFANCYRQFVKQCSEEKEQHQNTLNQLLIDCELLNHSYANRVETLAALKRIDNVLDSLKAIMHPFGDCMEQRKQGFLFFQPLPSVQPVKPEQKVANDTVITLTDDNTTSEHPDFSIDESYPLTSLVLTNPDEERGRSLKLKPGESALMDSIQDDSEDLESDEENTPFLKFRK